MAGLGAVDTVRDAIHLLKKNHSLPDAIYFLLDFKSRLLMLPSASTKKRP